ncbi:Scr1 family TA system antitoxin-like transcriptional regulator [Streptomyces avermitilis]
MPVYSKTKVFRVWHPTLMWGTLQTADYAAETFRQVVDYYEIPDDAEAATAKRLERQQYLYQGNRIFNVVLGEQALYTNFGGPDVMKGQHGGPAHRGPPQLTTPGCPLTSLTHRCPSACPWQRGTGVCAASPRLAGPVVAADAAERRVVLQEVGQGGG